MVTASLITVTDSLLDKLNMMSKNTCFIDPVRTILLCVCLQLKLFCFSFSLRVQSNQSGFLVMFALTVHQISVVEFSVLVFILVWFEGNLTRRKRRTRIQASVFWGFVNMWIKMENRLECCPALHGGSVVSVEGRRSLVWLSRGARVLLCGVCMSHYGTVYVLSGFSDKTPTV